MNLVTSQPNIRVLKDSAAITLIGALTITLALFLLVLGLSESLTVTLYEARALAASLRGMTKKRPQVVPSTCTEVEPAPPAPSEPIPVDLTATG